MRGREGQDYPADDKVEEKHRVHHQSFTVGGLAVGEECCGGKSGPAKGCCHHQKAHDKADCSWSANQDDPTHDHGHSKRQDAVSQNTQALEERDCSTQKLGVEGDDNGAEPDDNKDLRQMRDYIWKVTFSWLFPKSVANKLVIHRGNVQFYIKVLFRVLLYPAVNVNVLIEE